MKAVRCTVNKVSMSKRCSGGRLCHTIKMQEEKVKKTAGHSNRGGMSFFIVTLVDRVSTTEETTF